MCRQRLKTYRIIIASQQPLPFIQQTDRTLSHRWIRKTRYISLGYLCCQQPTGPLVDEMRRHLAFYCNIAVAAAAEVNQLFIANLPFNLISAKEKKYLL